MITSSASKRFSLGMAVAIAAVVQFPLRSVRADALFSWGSDQKGQLGLGSSAGTATQATPQLVSALGSTVASVSAGGAAAYAVANDGTVYDWGSNTGGQLGNGAAYDFVAHSTPTAVSGLSAGSGVTQITSEAFDGLVIKNGSITDWGFNSDGELGNGGASAYTPSPASPLPGTVSVVAGGYSTGYAIVGGALYGWGLNPAGQVGDGTKTTRSTPTPVTNLSSGVTAVAGGQSFAVAIKDGAVYAWGSNALGQLGNGTTYFSPPTPAPAALVSGIPTGATQVAAGIGHALALVNNTIYAWGYNNFGQIGNNSTSTVTTPTAVTGIAGDIISIAAGGFSSYALTDDGSLWVWGSNASGQLGLGNQTDEWVPTHLLRPPDTALPPSLRP